MNYNNLKTEYNAVLNFIMVTLLRAYNNTKKVTNALLYSHFVDLLRKTDLIKEENCYILTIVAFICISTYCFNSITHITVSDLLFKLYNHKNQEENQENALKYSILKKQLRLLQEEFKENLIELAEKLTGIQESSN